MGLLSVRRPRHLTHPYLFSGGEDKDLEVNKVICHYHGDFSGVYAPDLAARLGHAHQGPDPRPLGTLGHRRQCKVPRFKSAGDHRVHGLDDPVCALFFAAILTHAPADFGPCSSAHSRCIRPSTRLPSSAGNGSALRAPSSSTL
ncbi:hypothetical protein J3R83DRAFT_5513 [Lanmaoa asiatica]|nr:hypothetical protein J3R83DRAFT_5513 [Lanmaoa asiatica]